MNCAYCLEPIVLKRKPRCKRCVECRTHYHRECYIQHRLHTHTDEMRPSARIVNRSKERYVAGFRGRA